MPSQGLLLCDDLLFSSRIVGEARSHGLTLRVLRTVADLLQAADESPTACALIDIHHEGLNLPDLVAHLRATGVGTIVGYGSHVAADQLRAARQAGCDQVLPRSQLVESLSEALPAWFGAPGSTAG